jgi:hypothetical protein
MRVLLPLAGLLLSACGGPAHVELEPASLAFTGRHQSGQLHATPRSRSGTPLPAARCAWSSSDPGVATVSGAGNDATVSSVGPGAATIACAIGGVLASAPVSVRVVSRVVLGQVSATLELSDQRRPLAVPVRAFDDQGSAVTGRLVLSRCDVEEVCRGDTRGQLWATGPGQATATFEVEGVRATLPVTVKDRRVDTRPRPVTRDYMEDLDREVRVREAKEAAAATAAGKR